MFIIIMCRLIAVFGLIVVVLVYFIIVHHAVRVYHQDTFAMSKLCTVA